MESKLVFHCVFMVMACTVLRVETTNTTTAPDINVSTTAVSIISRCLQGRVCSTILEICNTSAGSCLMLTNVVNSTKVTFILSGESSGYIAVGFSRNQALADGDTVYTCANESGAVKFIHATWNNSTHISPVNSPAGEFVEGAMNASAIQCAFTINVTTENSYVHLMRGSFINEILGAPEVTFQTNNSVDLKSFLSPTTAAPKSTGNNTTTSPGPLGAMLNNTTASPLNTSASTLNTSASTLNTSASTLNTSASTLNTSASTLNTSASTGSNTAGSTASNTTASTGSNTSSSWGDNSSTSVGTSTITPSQPTSAKPSNAASKPGSLSSTGSRASLLLFGTMVVALLSG